MKDKDIKNGKLYIGFRKLYDDDFKRILRKLASPQRERRPRKCQRLEGVSAILAKLPPPVPVHYLNFVGNSQIGDAGMAHLHLVPKSVVNFDLSDCGLTAEGIKVLCEFLETNTSITRMIMWGNEIGDEGAKYVADMLCVNTTLRELCVMDSQIGQKGFEYLSDALASNETLRNLSCGNDVNINDEHLRKLCPGLRVNRGLENLVIEGTNVTDVGVKCIEALLRDNTFLKHVKLQQPLNDGYIPTGAGSAWNNVCYWLALNRLNRKLITDDDATLSDWLEAIIKCSKHEVDLGFSYFFLRNKPELCMHFEAMN